MHVENYKENVKNPCFSVEKEGKLRGECVKRWWKDRAKAPLHALPKRMWNVEREQRRFRYDRIGLQRKVLLAFFGKMW